MLGVSQSWPIKLGFFYLWSLSCKLLPAYPPTSTILSGPHGHGSLSMNGLGEDDIYEVVEDIEL